MFKGSSICNPTAVEQVKTYDQSYETEDVNEKFILFL